MTLSRRQFIYLQHIGIDVWLDRSRPSVSDLIVEEDMQMSTNETAGSAVAKLDTLQAQVAGCTQCALHAGRTNTVFGTGDPHADWLVVGEAPGAEEDRQGVPFVGRAGRLLNAMLLAIGLQREKVYIANILKCRPPSNRDPGAEEVAACRSYLEQQIQLIRPKIILAVGRVAAQNLLGIDTPIGRMRGQRYCYPAEQDIPVVVTYHPAYLLRSPREKRKTWEDLKLAQRIYMALP